ncbi:MAG TPA: tetratricopeptide repeat protein [Pyrinomonadaceae bacterium]|nr:tetratricopeptide repeat protein [Pyrinomonadaceae bacterium]
MLKRSLLILFLVPALVLAVQPSQRVLGVVMTPEELAAVESADAPGDAETASAEKSKQEGNGFLRALKAPFKAFGRIFGGGKKNEQNKLQRISESDAKRFESVPARVVTDTRTISKEATSDVNHTTVAAAAASEYSIHLNLGREKLDAGDLNNAIAELSLALSLQPKSAEVMNLLGVAYEAKGLRKRALESFKAAVEADKDSSDYLNNYGFLLFRNNDFEEATKYLKRAAKLSPNDARIWNNLGLVQCQRGKFDDAFKSFARAANDFNAHLNVAAQLSAHGQAKDAIKHLEKAKELQPESVDVLAKLVSLYEMTGRVSDAEATRRSIVQLKTFADAKK